jgi:Helix-turn-helix domain
MRKTCKEKLKPTPTQERQLEVVLWRCRTLYNVALEQRITAWQRCHVCITRSQQEAELKAIREAFPEYAALHSHVLQDVLARLDTTYQAFFRRVANGEQPGFPAFRDAPAGTPSPTRSMAMVPDWRTARWSCRGSGVSPSGGVGLSRARSRPSPSRTRRTAGRSAAPVSRCPSSRYRLPDARPASMWG